MKLLSLVLAFAALTLVTGCGKKSKDITELERKQAAALFSEAEFAMTLRDFARAEPLFDKVTKLCPDTGDYWINLGVARKRQGNTAGAKSAYESAAKAYRETYKEDPKQSNALLQEIQTLMLLGRTADAKSALEKALKKAPENRELRVFNERGELERLGKDPGFKEIAL